MKCFLDLDGVLVDLYGGICQQYAVKSPYLNEINYGYWDLSKLLNIPVKDFWKPLGEEFWSRLKPTHDWENILMFVEKHFDRIQILTSPCPNDGCLVGKKNWVRKYIPEYVERLHIATDKSAIAHSNAVLIDDFDHNINAFNTEGGLGVLVPRYWNSLYEKADRVLQHLKNELAPISVK